MDWHRMASTAGNSGESRARTSRVFSVAQTLGPVVGISALDVATTSGSGSESNHKKLRRVFL